MIFIGVSYISYSIEEFRKQDEIIKPSDINDSQTIINDVRQYK